MAEYLSPAVYVEIKSSGIKPIEGVGTSTAGFVGHTVKGPIGQAIPIQNHAEFVKHFGGITDHGRLYFGVKAFFDEGGSNCYVVRAVHYEAPSPGAPAVATAVSSFSQFDGDNAIRNGLAASRIEHASGVAGIRFDGSEGDAIFSLRYDDATDTLTMRRGDGTEQSRTVATPAAGTTEAITFTDFGATVIVNQNLSADITLDPNSSSITGTGVIDDASITVTDAVGDVTAIRATTLTFDNLAGPGPITVSAGSANEFTGSFDGTATGVKEVTLADGNGDSLTLSFNITTAFDGAETAASISLAELANLVVSMPTKFRVEGLSPGSWGDDIGVKITPLANGRFDLDVEYLGDVVQQHNNLTMDKDDDDYVENRINHAAQDLIRVLDTVPMDSVLPTVLRQPHAMLNNDHSVRNGLVTSNIELDSGIVHIRFDDSSADAVYTLRYNDTTTVMTLRRGDGAEQPVTIATPAAGTISTAVFDTFGATVIVNENLAAEIALVGNSSSITGTGVIENASISVTNAVGDISTIRSASFGFSSLTTPEAITITATGTSVNGDAIEFVGLFDGTSIGVKEALLLDGNGNSLTLSFNVTTAFDGAETAASITYGDLANLVISTPYQTVLLSGGEDGLVNPSNPAESVMIDADYIGEASIGNGLRAFDKVEDVNLVAVPEGVGRDVHVAGMAYCERRGDCFYIAASQQEIATANDVIDYKNAQGIYSSGNAVSSKFGAFYTPWIYVFDPRTAGRIAIPPSAAVAGRYANIDGARGVHKVAAGIADGRLRSALGVTMQLTHTDQEKLNPKGINVIRVFKGVGNVIWGARTVTSDPEWRYLNVVRLFLYLKGTIENGTGWVVFEPNDRFLWNSIIRNITAFLKIQWLNGALVGATEEEAFYVKCDGETNPQESRDLGRVITEIGVAPSKPAEFVVFRISQSAGQSSNS